MAQINLHVQPDFEEDLARFMKLRGIKTKSEAIRVAVREGLERSTRASHTDFSRWRGWGLRAACNPNPRFSSDEELWQEPSRTERPGGQVRDGR